MKFHLTFLALILFGHTVCGQRDTILINGMKFLTIKQTVKSEYNKKDTLLKFYGLQNGARQFLFEHYLYRYGADAENEFKDIGTIQISNDSIILKTHYFQKGNDPIPEWRKRIYKVTSAGKLSLVFDKCRQKNSKKWTTCSID
jgi:hypothetical protein